jgi:hypothetical protein
MARKPRTPPAAFTSLEDFYYLLTELELAVGSGKIEWSTASARNVRRRLDKLTATVCEVISQLENP